VRTMITNIAMQVLLIRQTFAMVPASLAVTERKVVGSHPIWESVAIDKGLRQYSIPRLTDVMSAKMLYGSPFRLPQWKKEYNIAALVSAQAMRMPSVITGEQIVVRWAWSQRCTQFRC